MKKLIMILAVMAVAVPAHATDLVLIGVFDGPLTGGVPKFAEFYACNEILDLSVYGVGVPNNGGGTDGREYDFPADQVDPGTSIYLSFEVDNFTAYMGFAPTYSDGIMSINGDDPIELYENDTVIDVYGEVCCDGTGTAWEYADSFAKRNITTGPDGDTFVIGSWYIPGIDVLDGETSNDTAVNQYPIGFECDPTIPTEQDSWGSLKTLYR